VIGIWADIFIDYMNGFESIVYVENIVMRILVCTSEYYPHGSGIANVAYYVVENLKKRGMDCTVCSPTGPDIKLGSSKLIQKTGIIGLIYYWNEVNKYVNTQDKHYELVWCHNPLFLKKDILNQSIMTMNSTYYGECIHGNFPLWLGVYKKIASVLEKYSLNKLKPPIKFTGVGKNICSELKDIGINEDRIYYIPNGVNIELFKPSNQKELIREKYGIPTYKKIILSIGRLTDVKQPLKLVEFFSVVEKYNMNIVLVVAGEGELLNKAKEMAKDKKIENILFLGHVDHKKDVPNLYACSDYFIMISKYEGGEPPLALAEAMASGLPCIVSEIPNFKIVKEANCGLIIDSDNTETSAKNIINYIQTDTSRHSYNARKYIENNLDWTKICDMYIRLFSEHIL